MIHHLRTCQNQEAIVILQKDAEGNGFSPMRDLASNDPAIVERYVAETTWYGDVCSGGDDGVPCVVFVPIN